MLVMTLEDAYAAAWKEWFESDVSNLWDSVVGDGLESADDSEAEG